MSSPASEAAERVRYRFGLPVARGSVGGVRTGQLAAVGSALLGAVVILRLLPDAAGAALAAVEVGAVAAIALVPVRGRTLAQWAAVGAWWRWSGSLPVADAAPARGVGWSRSGLLAATAARPVRAADPFGGLEVVAVPARRGGELGAVVDRAAGLATAAFVVRGHGFALASSADQDRAVATWAGVLSGLAGRSGQVRRLQWVATRSPGAAAGDLRALSERIVPGAQEAAAASYRSLLEDAADHVALHSTTVAVQVPARSARRRGALDADALGVSLSGVLDDLARSLRDAGIEVEGALGPASLATRLAEAARAVPPAPGGRAFPMATEAGWDRIRSDGLVHAGYWIAQWPRSEVTADFLAPLCFAPARSTVSVVMEPVAPIAAARQTARARTADLAEQELRSRGGFVSSARHARARHLLDSRDAELAEGHALFRFSGYVLATADDEVALEAHCDALEAAAARSHLVLERLYGAQGWALAACLPLCRGLS